MKAHRLPADLRIDTILSLAADRGIKCRINTESDTLRVIDSRSPTPREYDVVAMFNVMRDCVIEDVQNFATRQVTEEEYDILTLCLHFESFVDFPISNLITKQFHIENAHVFSDRPVLEFWFRTRFAVAVNRLLSLYSDKKRTFHATVTADDARTGPMYCELKHDGVSERDFMIAWSNAVCDVVVAYANEVKKTENLEPSFLTVDFFIS